MEQTRTSIQDTVEELKERVGETFDWRQYVYRHPGASLGVAVVTGALLGRGVAGLVLGDRAPRYTEHYGYGGDRPAEVSGESALAGTVGRPAPLAEAARPLAGPRRAMTASWGRLGGRVEGIVNRVIDEVTDAIEATLVPALSTWLRSRLDFAAPTAGGQGWSGEDRSRRAGVYTGGPAGPQHYPAQGRTAEHA
jgi:hypothetical protein